MGPDSHASDEIRRFEEQYRQQPDSLVFARLADAYRKAGQPDRALDVLDEGLIRHPDYPSGHIVRARALRDRGRVEEALESFRRVLELDAANLVAVRELAGLADERGDVAEARHWYEQLSQMDPTNLEVQQRVRELEAESQDAGSEDGGGAEEGPHTWWDDSAVTLSAGAGDAGPEWGSELELADVDTREDSDGVDAEVQPADDVVEAILNGHVPQTVRKEDTWWYEEAQERDEPEPSRDADLLTRTMADLYAEQGLHSEAAEIYEELLKDSPGDPDLLARLEAVRESGREAQSAPPVDVETYEDEPVGAQDALESGELPDLPGAVDDPAPIGRPAGPPWTEDLHRLLRTGEEHAAALPAIEIRDPLPEPAPAAPSRADDEVADDEVSGDEGPSRFARDWIQGLETEG